MSLVKCQQVARHQVQRRGDVYADPQPPCDSVPSSEMADCAELKVLLILRANEEMSVPLQRASHRLVSVKHDYA